MKKIFFIVIMAVFLVSSVYTVFSAADFSGKTNDILVTLTRQEPDPVEPGKQVEVSFKLDNNQTDAKNLVFEILPEYPFSLSPTESASVSLGNFGISQNARSSITVKYNLIVAKDASDGDYRIKIRYKYGNFDTWVTNEELKIKVQTHDAILGIDSFSVYPPITSPGDMATMRIQLKNYATSPLKNVKLKLDLSESNDEDHPFSPVESTNEKIIPYMDSQEKIPVEFKLLVDADASSKPYKIPLNLYYSDTLNKNYSKENIVSVVVGDTPDLIATLERTEVYTSGSSGNVVIRFANKGVSDVKFLNAGIIENENVKVIGAKESYIGKLDSDDFSTSEFNLELKGEDKVKIPLHVTYSDSNNRNYKDDIEVEMKLYSEKEAKKLGLKEGNGTKWFLILIAVIAGVFFYIKKRNKKNE